MFASAFWSFIEFGVNLVFLSNILVILMCVFMIAYLLFTSAPTTKALRAVTDLFTRLLFGALENLKNPNLT